MPSPIHTLFRENMHMVRMALLQRKRCVVRTSSNDDVGLEVVTFSDSVVNSEVSALRVLDRV